MWRALIDPLVAAGYRVIAPDLAGFGDSPPAASGSWEAHVDSLARLHAELGLGPVALVMHDWGTLIGLRWACANPAAIASLVISSGGFFPDGRWHALARTMRTPDEGERLIESIERDGFASMLGGASTGIGADAVSEYWKCFADPKRRAAQLELYRSGDFEKLRAYEGCLAALDVPVLLLWGAKDQFAPLAGAHRFEREIPAAELVVLEDAGHFVWEDRPEETAQALLSFLARAQPAPRS